MAESIGRELRPEEVSDYEGKGVHFDIVYSGVKKFFGFDNTELSTMHARALQERAVDVPGFQRTRYRLDQSPELPFFVQPENVLFNEFEEEGAARKLSLSIVSMSIVDSNEHRSVLTVSSELPDVHRGLWVAESHVIAPPLLPDPRQFQN